jgi:hypothetical protein
VAGVIRALAAPERRSDYPLMCGYYASFLSAGAMARICGMVNPLSWSVALVC